MSYLETKDYSAFQLIDTAGIITDTFLGYDSIKPAYPGDLLGPDRRILEIAPKPPYVGVLHIMSKTIYGMTARGVPIYFFEPLDSSLPPMIVGCSTAKDYSKNILVIVTFERWNKTDKYPRGILTTILGECGHTSTEKLALLHRYSPFPQPKNKYKENPTKNLVIAYHYGLTESEPLTGFTFNIDPPGCEDVDDVFTIKQIYNGWRLSISITDVACAIPPTHSLSEYALQVGQTLYPDDREPKHMIPPYVGVDLLSLRPGKLRNVISLTVDWTPSAGLSKPIWSLRTASVDKSYTYDEASNETRIEFTGLRTIVDAIALRPVSDSHEWVETLMLLYNKEAGKLLKSAGIGILRGHDAPDQDKFDKMSLIHPDLKIYAYSAAKYMGPTGPSFHWGIGTDTYAHASSPLRRYADLYNQWCIRAILLNEPIQNFVPTNKTLRDLNRLQKNAKSFERDLFFINVLASNSETDVNGIVVSATLNKVSVYVADWKRIIRVKRDPRGPVIEVSPGQNVQVSYYVKADCARWKDKIVFNLKV